MEGAHDLSGKSPAEHQILDELQAELERYEHIIGITRAILTPVLTTYDSPERAMVQQPEEAPQHDYHNALLRLRQLNNRFEELRSAVKL